MALLLLTLFTACQRTELCFNHYPKASLMLGWEREWERDYGRAHNENWNPELHGFHYDDLRPATPEWVNMVVYKDLDSNEEHYFSPDGGDIALSANENYSFLLYNGDTEYIVLSDIASLPEARASATPRSRSSISYIAERHPGVRSANPPDLLYASFLGDVPKIGIHETLPLNLMMKPLVYTYVIRYEFAKGLEYVSLARGALAGMAESVYLRDGRTSDDPIIILYDCEVKDYGCEAHVKSFGVPGFPDAYYGRSAEEAPERPYTLNLEVLLTTGKVVEFNFDISDQLKDQPRGGVITVSGLEIEVKEDDPPQSPSGFDVDLSGWGQEDVEFPLDS